MKIDKRFTILGLCIVVFFVSIIIGISFALPESLTSSEYTISNNTLYVVPTSFDVRAREVLKKVESSNSIVLKDSSNNTLNDIDYVTNGYKMNTNNTTYNIIVTGDLTNDGKISLSDVSKLYNSYKGKTTLDENELKAGDTVANNKIDLGDVSKLYNFYRGKNPLSYYSDEYKVSTYIDSAKSYYSTHSTSSNLGTNIINKLDLSETNSKDKIVITKSGKVEAAILKGDTCYRKSALNDYIEWEPVRDCNANIDYFYSNSGKLHVTGSKLYNEYNREVRLKGTTTGIYLDSETQNENHTDDTYFTTLRNWGTNVFRIFIGSKLKSTDGENYEAYFNKLKDLIRLTEKYDMYIIINFDPAGYVTEPTWKDRAEEFFNEMLDIYGNNPRIIYEIWNEPNASTDWPEVKAYAERVIPVIRAKAPDSLILVGTPNFDKRADLVLEDPLSYPNVMYTQHMYTLGATDESINNLLTALDGGLPIFVSEWAAVQGNPPKKGSYIDEAQAMSFAKIMQNYNLSFIHFTSGRSVWSYGFINWFDYEFDATYPENKLTGNALLYKRLLYDDVSTNYFMMKENSDANGVDYRSPEWKDKIKTVSFKNKLEVPSNAVITWDLSQIHDNSVIGYLKPTNEANMYDLVICANGIINLPMISRYLFQGLTNVVSYDFSNVETKMIFNMSYMFKDNNNLISIDLSTFDVDYLRYAYGLFQNDAALTSINFDGWAPTIEGLANMFSGCSSLTELDLTNFDVSKTDSFNGVFYKTTSLHTLDISTWSPTNVKSINNAFKKMPSITSLNLSGFTTFSEDYSHETVFDEINPSVTITTGNTTFKNDMKSLYPSLNIQ